MKLLKVARRKPPVSVRPRYRNLRHGRALLQHEDARQRVFQAEHDRLEAEVRERTAQLTELTRHLLRAREDERHRLARDLHDELGALLTSAKLDAARLQAQLGPDAAPAHERLAHLVGALDASITLGRRIVEDLRPSTLSHLGLPAALEMLLRDGELGAGLQVHLALHPVPLSASAELVVYRLVQEALTNLRKHAQAREVWVDLRRADGRVVVSVRDDGGGFDSRQAMVRAFGLLGMRHRVESEHGTLDVVSAPGRGTEVRASLPESA